MNDTIERLADGTLVFLPERLNRDPAVLRGLTNDEMWVALGTDRSDRACPPGSALGQHA
jgi:hypothetical protein